jgi:hypothetical protein
MGLKIGKFFKKTADKLKKPVRGAFSALTAGPRAVGSLITGSKYRVIDTKRNLIQQNIDRGVGLAAAGAAVVGGPAIASAVGGGAGLPKVLKNVKLPSIRTPKISLPKLPVTMPSLQTPANLPTIRPNDAFLEGLLSTTGVTNGVSVGQQPSSFKGVSGGVQFGNQTMQAWLPFAIIGGIVLIILASGGILFKSK